MVPRGDTHRTLRAAAAAGRGSSWVPAPSDMAATPAPVARSSRRRLTLAGRRSSAGRLGASPLSRTAEPVLELDGTPRANALVGGEHDAQRAHRVVHRAAEIEILADRLEEEGLLAVAELLVVGLVLHVDPLVALDEV